MSTYSGQASNLMNGINQAVVAAANLIALLGLAIVVDPLGAAILVVTVSVLGLVLRPLRSAVRQRSGRSADAGMTLATSSPSVRRPNWASNSTCSTFRMQRCFGWNK